MPGPSKLNPLDRAALSDDEYELAQALRAQFEDVDEETLRAYAKRSHRDVSRVSRALSGKEVPSWDLIEDLAAHAAHDRGEQKPSVATMRDFRAKHNRVLTAPTRKPGHVLHLVKQQLAAAELEIGERSQREVDLRNELQEAQTYRANLDSQVLALESGQVRALTIGGAQLALARDEDQLRAQREEAERTIADLRVELEQERDLRQQAEKRLKDLRALLQASREAEDMSSADDGEIVSESVADLWWPDEEHPTPKRVPSQQTGSSRVPGRQYEGRSVGEARHAAPHVPSATMPTETGRRHEAEVELAQAKMAALELRVEDLETQVQEAAVQVKEVQESLNTARSALRVAAIDLERETHLRTRAEQDALRLQRDLDSLTIGPVTVTEEDAQQAARHTWMQLGHALMNAEDDKEQPSEASA